ncbi:MAG: hypothetical protein IKW81_10310 [Pseudobutyrivibrio sp.]|nr:hypothetical protein [Pseudobutyrivibrio sp.]
MRIKDVIETLNQYDPNTELVINVEGEYISPEVKRDFVTFKHRYNGVLYKDEAVVLTN